MLASLSGSGLDCEVCEMRPGLIESFGCGRPPSRPLPRDVDDMCSRAPDGGRLDPFARVQRGDVAYAGLGYGSIRRDWDCCPRYHGQLSAARLGGTMTAVFARKAASWRDKGALLALLDGGEPTEALIEALDITDRLDLEREHIQAEERASESARRKADREATRGR